MQLNRVERDLRLRQGCPLRTSTTARDETMGKPDAFSSARIAPTRPEVGHSAGQQNGPKALRDSRFQTSRHLQQ